MPKSSKDIKKILSATALAGCAITSGAAAQAESVMAPVPTLGNDAGYKINTASTESDATFVYSTYDAETKTVTDALYDIEIKKTTYGEGNTEYSANELLQTPNFDEITVNYDEDITRPINATTENNQYYYGGTSLDGDVVGLTAPVTVSKQFDSISGTYYSNYVTSSNSNYHRGFGGAIYNAGYIDSISSDFISNVVHATTTQGFGGAIASDGAYESTKYGIGSIVGDFVNNSVYSTYDFAAAGAISNSAPIGSITGNFISNHAFSEESFAVGGAILNDSGGYDYEGRADINSIKGDFLYNTAESLGDWASGGAISNMEVSKIGSIEGDFVGNLAYAMTDANGGAIENYGTIEEIKGNFIKNSVDGAYGTGGAIYNAYVIDNINGEFIGNSAVSYDYRSNGGAIYNEGQISELSGAFVNNFTTASYTANGGAISNLGTFMDINADFIGNYAEAEEHANGGAIYNDGVIGDINGNFINNHAVADNSSSYYSTYGGAISNINEIGNITGDFYGNYSSAYGGAISNDNGVLGNITGDFSNNYAYNDSNSIMTAGGAIYNFAWSSIGDITGNFTNNYVENPNDQAFGGAILNEASYIGNINGNFTGNYATGLFAKGGAISNDNYIDDSFIGDITGNFVGNKVVSNSNDPSINSTSFGGAIYNNCYVGNISGSFDNNSATSSGLALGGAIYNGGQVGVIPVQEQIITDASGNVVRTLYYSPFKMTQDDAVASSDKEFIITSSNTNTETEFLGWFDDAETIDEAITEQYEKWNGSYLTEIPESNGSCCGFVNSLFTNNSAISENGEAKGGAIYTMSDTKIVATDGYTTLIEGNYTESAGVRDDNAIYMDNIDGTLTFELKNKGNVVLKDNIDGLTMSTLSVYPDEELHDGYNVNITGDGTGTFYLHNDIRNADVTMGGVNLDTINDNIHNYEFNTLALNGNVNMVADVDLQNEVMDRFSAKEYGEHTGSLNVVGLNMISDMQEGKDSAEIMFAEQGLKDNVAGNIAMPSEDVQTTFYSPIFKYNATYENRDDAGYFIFARGDKIGNSGAYNPAVLGSSVASTAGAMSTMSTTFNYAFQNSDNFMNIPYLERIAIRDRNKYALSPTGDATDVGTFSPLFTRQETASAWVKPYATFESVNLDNGPKVSNITYGTLVGFDTELESIKGGWDRVFTGYIGYNGASQRYSGVDSYQNGGLLGGTMTLYKGNFFNATTLSTGASVVNSSNMYVNENFAMLLAGIGNKMGYNFEFKEGKVILQPSMLVSYTFVNTFDYTNAAGVRIDNDPLHALQLAPGLKLIGNTKGGWQPYLGVSMVWNMMDNSSATANGVKLPSMSVKPYVQYGVGVQKRMKDNFMAFGQAMIQNGGRNGISLTAGFRWAIGKDKDDSQKVFKPFLKKEAKKIGSEAAKQLSRHPEVKTEGSRTSNEILRSAQNDGSRKILKQMMPEQRMVYGARHNTSRTASSGMLKQL